MKRIILINPPLQLCLKGQAANPVVDNLFFNSPPLGICYIASVLEKDGVPVGIIDAAVERLTHEAVLARVREFGADIVGISSTSFAFADAAALARFLKEREPGLVLVLGGPHATSLPEKAMDGTAFDYAVIGEGEITFPALVRHLDHGIDVAGVDGIAFRREGQTLLTKPRELIKDLDELPFPARHLVPMHLYRPQPNDEKVRPKVSMISSRGCPYECIFCEKSVFGRSYRSFSPGYIVSEMEFLARSYGARDIAFVDSLFAVSEERVELLVDEIRKRGLKINWTCTVRANVIKSREILRRMKEAGCWRVRIGIESGSEEVLRFIKKTTTREQIRNVATWADREGLQPKGFFMVGHLPETEATINETIAFAKTLPLKDITIQINTPLPGTEQYGLCREYGELLTEDFSRFSYWDVVFVPKGMTKDSLKAAVNRFYRSFYLRPSVIWRHLAHIRGLKDVLRYCQAAGLVVYLFFGRATGRGKGK